MNRTPRAPRGHPLDASTTSDGGQARTAGKVRKRMPPSGEHIEVVVRIRPLIDREAGEQAVWDTDGRTLHKIVGKEPKEEEAKNWQFDKVFGPHADSREVYELSCKRLVDRTMDSGTNSVLFAYGQTGAGKSYTISAIMRYAVRDVWKFINDHPGHEVRLFVSGLEIYNEALYDLLTKTPQTSTTGGAAPTTPLSARVAGQWGLASSKGTPRGDSPHAHGVGALSSSTSRGGLEIMEDPEKGVVVPGLIEMHALSEEHLMSIIHTIEANRRKRHTLMNDASSRSHQIVQIMVESTKVLSKCLESCDSTNGIDTVYRRVMTFVDLAGSERQVDVQPDSRDPRDSSKTAVEHLQTKEACNINSSLLVLGTVIRALDPSQGNRHVPFRDSRLTFFLKPALSGNARMAIICTIAPTEGSFESTRGTLRFATDAKKVVVAPKVTEIKDPRMLIKNLQAKLHQAQLEISRLTAQLEVAQENLHASEATCAALEDRIRSLEEKRAKAKQWEAERAAMEAHARELGMKLEEIQVAKAEAAETARERDSLVQQQVADLQEQLAAARVQQAELHDALEELKTQLEEVHAKAAQERRVTLEAAEAQASDWERERSFLEERAQHAEESLQQMAQEREQQAAEAARLREEYEVTRSTLDAALAAQEELRSQLESLGAQQGELQQALQGARTTLAEAQQQREALQSQLAAAEELREALQGQLAAEQARAAALLADSADVQRAQGDQQQSLEEARAELASTQQQLEGLQAELTAAQERVGGLQQELEAARKAEGDAQAMLDGERSHVEIIEGELDILRTENHELSQKLQEAQGELAAARQAKQALQTASSIRVVEIAMQGEAAGIAAAERELELLEELESATQQLETVEALYVQAERRKAELHRTIHVRTKSCGDQGVDTEHWASIWGASARSGAAAGAGQGKQDVSCMTEELKEVRQLAAVRKELQATEQKYAALQTQLDSAQQLALSEHEQRQEAEARAAAAEAQVTELQAALTQQAEAHATANEAQAKELEQQAAVKVQEAEARAAAAEARRDEVQQEAAAQAQAAEQKSQELQAQLDSAQQLALSELEQRQEAEARAAAAEARVEQVEQEAAAKVQAAEDRASALEREVESLRRSLAGAEAQAAHWRDAASNHQQLAAALTERFAEHRRCSEVAAAEVQQVLGVASSKHAECVDLCSRVMECVGGLQRSLRPTAVSGGGWDWAAGTSTDHAASTAAVISAAAAAVAQSSSPRRRTAFEHEEGPAPAPAAQDSEGLSTRSSNAQPGYASTGAGSAGLPGGSHASLPLLSPRISNLDSHPVDFDDDVAPSPFKPMASMSLMDVDRADQTASPRAKMGLSGRLTSAGSRGTTPKTTPRTLASSLGTTPSKTTPRTPRSLV